MIQPRIRRFSGGRWVTDIHPEAREEFARNHGVQSFPTLEELCDAVDVIDLCTPARNHEPLVVTSLERGKHVVIEKTFTFPKEIMLREAIASCDLGCRTEFDEDI
jgi:3-hydroxyisobutyrate dehydrogenase-like beta-hydroxyacid dehydrogenase